KVKVKDPEEYDGSKPEKLRHWLISLENFFLGDLCTYQEHRNRIITACSYLTGKALNWYEGYVESILDGRPPAFLASWPEFKTELNAVFGIRFPRDVAVQKLEALFMREDHTVSQYALDFEPLARQSGWDMLSLADRFYKGLPRRIKEVM
ncbi:hypothetical protein AURDEDRAFT_28818, partial [Auricularia subglabra TFB-10046 SS5]